MAKGSRPDLLPFALPRTIGLPYHGLVTDSELALPNSSVISYLQPSDGSTIAVQHPLASAVSRTAAEQANDDAKGYQWQNYALLSGKTRQIGGQVLGQTKQLYCDSQSTWIIRVVTTSGVGHFDLSVYLNDSFGVLSSDADRYSMSERLLATARYVPTSKVGNPVTFRICGNVSCATSDKTGALTIVQVGSTDGTTTVWPRQMNSQACGSTTAAYLHDVVRVTISGTGSLEPGNIGAGISATLTHVAGATDMYELWEAPYDPAVVEYIRTERWNYVVEKDSTETNAEWTHHERRYTSIRPDGDYDVYWTIDEEFSFGGNTIPSYMTMIGITGSGLAYFTGTIDVNGVATDYTDLDVSGSGFAFLIISYFYQLLPMVLQPTIENLPAYIMTASGSMATTTTPYWHWCAHNAYTDEIKRSENDPICFV